MKASLRFREDQRPLLRAKVPVSVLGLPLVSGVAAGEARELRLDLATAFDAGPALRLSYCPNNSSSPFSLAIKTGVGPLGSPAGAPFAINAEFSLLAGAGGPAPAFSLLFKPRLGDFAIKKTARSAHAGEALPPAMRKVAPVDDSEETPVAGFLQPQNGIGKENGFAPAIAASGGGGPRSLLHGLEVRARSALPIWSRAVVKFSWGVRVPAELRAAMSNGRSASAAAAGFSLGKLPLLVMDKISIEHVAAGEGRPKAAAVAGCREMASGDVKEACFFVSRQLEALQAENGLLRKAVEELRAEVGLGKKAAATAAGGRVNCGTDAVKGGVKVAAGATAGRRDRRNERTSPDNSGRLAAEPEDVNEELKALMGATGGAGI